jgi:hypothetical protein
MKQWFLTDRCHLLNTVKSAEELIESLLEKLLLLLHHSFIAMQEAMFLKEVKCNIQTGEFVILCDFAENYFLFCKMKLRGFREVTFYPFVAYLKKLNALNTEHENVVMLSDCLKNDSIQVHTFSSR